MAHHLVLGYMSSPQRLQNMQFITTVPGLWPGWDMFVLVCLLDTSCPSWLCEESVMALREVRQVGILPVEAEASLHR